MLHYKIKIQKIIALCLPVFLLTSHSLALTTEVNSVTLSDTELEYVDSTYDFIDLDTYEPKSVLETREEVLQVINYHLMNMEQQFDLQIKNFGMDKLPKNLSELERQFVETISFIVGDSDKISFKLGSVSTSTAIVRCKVIYNDAGKVVLHKLYNQPLSENDTKALEILAVAEEIIKQVRGKSDLEKVVYIHDYIIQTSSIIQSLVYDDFMQDTRTPYGVLVHNSGSADGEGYAETMQMLCTLLGIENRVVWSEINQRSDKGSSILHFFNKVKIGSEWYNVDVCVDDPYGNNAESPNARSYLLVSDAVSSQRYTWNTKRYPQSTVENNWHHRNNLVATTQEDVEKIVREAIAQKEAYISIWLPDYTREKYQFTFIKDISMIESYTAKYVTAIQDYRNSVIKEPVATAMLIEFKYK